MSRRNWYRAAAIRLLILSSHYDRQIDGNFTWMLGPTTPVVGRGRTGATPPNIPDPWLNCDSNRPWTSCVENSKRFRFYEKLKLGCVKMKVFNVWVLRKFWLLFWIWILFLFWIFDVCRFYMKSCFVHKWSFFSWKNWNFISIILSSKNH